MKSKGQNKDFLGNYDFSRTDKFFSLTIPLYHIEYGVVFYEIHLKDLVTSEKYMSRYRFRQIRKLHTNLLHLKFELPPFPKTHFWTHTNNNPTLIQKRRKELQTYLQHVINDPFVRGCSEIKQIIRKCKQNRDEMRRLSSKFEKNSNCSQATTMTRSYSQQKGQYKNCPKDETIKRPRKYTLTT